MMFIDEFRNIKSGRKELRKFGFSIGIILIFLSCLLFWQGKHYTSLILSVSIIFLLIGLFLPICLKPIHKVWMGVAILLGWVMTRVILIISFYLIVTPIALVSRLVGKDFLDRKFDKSKESYWIPREEYYMDKKNYENQF